MQLAQRLHRSRWMFQKRPKPLSTYRRRNLALRDP
jgi:hypothetical protein